MYQCKGPEADASGPLLFSPVRRHRGALLHQGSPVREVAGSIQTLSRIKRKVRLAAGLNSDNTLSAEAMERGWQCLRLFAERLQDPLKKWKLRLKTRHL